MMGARPTYGAGAVGVGHGGSVPRWSLRLLGPFVLECDGVPVTGFRSDKVRALLAYLAVEPGRPWSRSTLADLLWPDRPEGVARSNLRSALSNLRRVLDDARAEQARRAWRRLPDTVEAFLEHGPDLLGRFVSIRRLQGHARQHVGVEEHHLVRLEALAEGGRGPPVIRSSAGSAVFEP
jgi:hypothetical protein